MERYFQTVALLGVNDGNLPVHRGMRQRRYDSVEKILDLLDVSRRVGPKFPLDALFLDPTDPEWDDDMTYLYVEYPFYKNYLTFATFTSVIFLYNYRLFFRNRNMQFATKSILASLFVYSNVVYYKYRKQVLRCNLFDEYVQMRADELVKEREPLLNSEEVKKWIWYSADLEETLIRCHRQSFKNDASDFADSELLLQDFVRRYSDETSAKPLSMANSRIGI
eukprot:NODE_3799_length_730_cov_59.308370_g3202_i0.p1 GENE.NODE_3799_length_730_cov_59.308370_g3202_i0~~NODE_3799_length_730_cov_59.308370_g3202_i0.p1  ORF type:complete len:222 (+),score=62.72 NODE_3799_length_730_cov_59.308370_g3202_i0:42-707(+)